MPINPPLSPAAPIRLPVQIRRESEVRQRQRGRKAWVTYLCGVGRQSDAIRFCRLHRLPESLVVVSAPSILVSDKSIRSVNPADLHAPSSVSPADADSVAPLPSSRSAPIPAGEGGVEAQALTDNYNTSALGVKIPQSVEVKQDEASGGGVKLVEASSGSLGPKSGVGSALKETKRSLQFRSPRGELEGKSGFSQAISEASEKLIKASGVGGGMGGGWVEVGEGVIGGICRNKEYARVRIVGGSEEWAKCAVSGYSLFNGEVVKVKRVWVSGDGRDAEYEIVGRVELEKQPGVGDMTAKAVGFVGGSLRGAGQAAEEVVEVVEVREDVRVDEGEGFLDRMRKEAEAWMGKKVNV